MGLRRRQDEEGEEKEEAHSYAEDGEVVRDAKMGFPVWERSVAVLQNLLQGRCVPSGYTQSYIGHGEQQDARLEPTTKDPSPHYSPD
jgi:hypothetical protein